MKDKTGARGPAGELGDRQTEAMKMRGQSVRGPKARKEVNTTVPEEVRDHLLNRNAHRVKMRGILSKIERVTLKKPGSPGAKYPQVLAGRDR